MGERARGPLPPTFFLIYLADGILLHYIVPIVMLIQLPYALLGIPLIVFGVALNIWADRLFKQKQTTVKPYEKPSVLVAEGPFRLSRHPMYLGFVSILLGVAVLLGSLSVFLAPVAMVVTLELLFIPHEERDMEAAFGEAYRDYKKRVRRWL